MTDLELENDTLKKDFFSTANLDEYKVGPELMTEFFNGMKDQVLSNIIQNFGIGRLLEATTPTAGFQDGGNVDTIHNVENGMALKSKAAQERYEKQKEYVYKDYHDKNEDFMVTRNKRVQELRNGTAIDQATGKRFHKNQAANLDHTISGKEISQDASLALSGIKGADIANRETNLQYINEGVNKSKQEKSNAEYLAGNKQRVADSKKNISSLSKSDAKYEKKLNNNLGRIEADEQRLTEKDKVARAAYEKEKNKTYYHGTEFKVNLGKTSIIQGGSMALKQAAGLIVYDFSKAILTEFRSYLTNWNNNKGKRIAEFNEMILRIKNNLAGAVADIESKLIGTVGTGFASGVLANVCTVITNSYKRTSKNLARIINDGIGGIGAGMRLLATNPQHLERKQLIKAVIETISVAVTVSVGVIATDMGVKYLVAHGIPSNIADVTMSTITAIMTGIVAGLLICTIDNMGKIVSQVKAQFNTLMVGITVSPQSIEASYQQAVAKVETLYQELLTDIYQRYAETGRLQALAYDMDLPTADQFVASANLAEHVGVDQQKILRNRSEITNYFNS